MLMLLTDDDDGCFGCGEKNAAGLHMAFEEDAPPGTACARAFLDPRFQGWRGIAHGGILAVLFDDAMAYVGVKELGCPGVMARLNVRFRKPAPVGEIAVVRVRATRRHGKVLKLEGRVFSEGGDLWATAEGTFFGKEPPAPDKIESEEDVR